MNMKSGWPAPKRALILLAATALTIFLSMLPLGDLLTYPIRLFVTYVHELFHAVAALLTGGYVHSIAIHQDASGETMTAGGIGWIISMAGYVGTVLLGIICLRSMQRQANARGILVVFFSIAALTVFYTGMNSPFGTIVGSALAALFILTALYGHSLLADLLAAFTSIQLLFNAFYDLKTLLILSAGHNTHTDALNMQHSTGIPAIVWAILWLSLSGYAAYKLLLQQR